MHNPSHLSNFDLVLCSWSFDFPHKRRRQLVHSAYFRDRVAFGSALSEDSLVRHTVAQSRMEIAQVTYSQNSDGHGMIYILILASFLFRRTRAHACFLRGVQLTISVLGEGKKRTDHPPSSPPPSTTVAHLSSVVVLLLPNAAFWGKAVSTSCSGLRREIGGVWSTGSHPGGVDDQGEGGALVAEVSHGGLWRVYWFHVSAVVGNGMYLSCAYVAVVVTAHGHDEMHMHLSRNGRLMMSRLAYCTWRLA